MIRNLFSKVKNKLFPIQGYNNYVKGVSRRNIMIRGNNNSIICKSKLGGVKITVFGNDHKLLIEEDCIIKNAHFWFEDQDNRIIIKSKTTIEEAHLAACETCTEIVIGNDCMLSSDIRIVTTDSHSIINVHDGERINHAKSVVIGDHCWIGTRVTINKGVEIGHNSVIASNTLVTKSFPNNVVIGGIPGTILKEGISWLRERI
ncbi:MAG: acyltransferase [Bacteroidaceae bacterium]|nr:acyltransferase [Bacteroidaceae bacterium]